VAVSEAKGDTNIDLWGHNYTWSRAHILYHWWLGDALLVDRMDIVMCLFISTGDYCHTQLAICHTDL